MSDRTDIIDHAAVTTEQFRLAAEKRARDAAKPEFHPSFDGVHCVEDACGVELPDVRIAAGRVRCVDCQRRIELLRGRQ